MEWNKEHRNNPTQAQPTDFWQSCKCNSMEDEQASTNGAGTTGYPQAEKWATDLISIHYTKATQNGPQI